MYLVLADVKAHLIFCKTFFFIFQPCDSCHMTSVHVAMRLNSFAWIIRKCNHCDLWTVWLCRKRWSNLRKKSSSNKKSLSKGPCYNVFLCTVDLFSIKCLSRLDASPSVLTTALKVLTNEKRGGLAVVSFDRSGFKLFSLWFSSKSMQAPSCERHKTAQRTLFLLFANNNCFPTSEEKLLALFEFRRFFTPPTFQIEN